MDTKQFKVTLDRIEEDLGVLLVRDDETLKIDVPTPLLPEGCREGDILTLEIRRDPEATADAKKRVSALLEKLKNKQ